MAPTPRCLDFFNTPQCWQTMAAMFVGIIEGIKSKEEMQEERCHTASIHLVGALAVWLFEALSGNQLIVSLINYSHNTTKENS